MIRDYDALLRFIAERRDMPFAWGRKANDCAAFAEGAMLAQTSKRLWAGLRWSSQTGALRLIVRAGGFDRLLSAHRPEIATAHAHRGDIAGVADPTMLGGIRLMIVEGPYLVGPGEHRQLRLPRAAMYRAWSID